MKKSYEEKVKEKNGEEKAEKKSSGEKTMKKTELLRKSYEFSKDLGFLIVFVFVHKFFYFV